MAIGDNDPVYWEARDVKDERSILENFFAELPGMGLNRFIGHYVGEFDLRFILCRAIVLGVKLPAGTAFPRDIKPWSDSIFDTMTAWAGNKGKSSLDNLCKALGINGKGGFDGSMVADAWANGEYATIAAYCMDDVKRVRSIFHKFEAAGY